MNFIQKPRIPETIIQYEFPEQSHVKLIVYNMLGQEIAILMDSIEQAGYHQVTWNGLYHDGRSAPSGVYLCRMETTNYQHMIKMMLLR